MPGNAERVVVAVDGSASSIRALRQGARVASALDLRLRVVTVWRRPGLDDRTLPGFLGRHAEALAAEATRTQVDAVEIVFGDSPPPDLERRVLEGVTVPTLLAESRGAEMLVVGSRGRGGFAGLLLGSVGAACAAHAGCAVLVCRATGGLREQAGPDDGHEDAPQQEIVVGVNGTRASTGALRQGARFAASMHLPLLAVCATGGADTPGLDAAAVLATAAKQVFGATASQWFRSSVWEGAPAAVLGRASEHARMLVIGYSGRTAPTSASSVSSSIALAAACPVVIFHASPASDAGSFDARSLDGLHGSG